MSDDDLVLKGKPKKEEPEKKQDAPEKDPGDPVNVTMKSTADGYVEINFKPKVRKLRLHPSAAMALSKGIYDTAQNAATRRARIIVPAMSMPPSRPN